MAQLPTDTSVCTGIRHAEILRVFETVCGDTSLAEVFSPLHEFELLLKKNWKQEVQPSERVSGNCGIKVAGGQIYVFSSYAPFLLCCSLASSFAEILLI